MGNKSISQRQAATVFLLLLIIAISVFIRAEYVMEGGTLLVRYDPYYHYRMAETIVEEGHRPEWDYMASWPTGEPVDHPPLYHYFLAYTFKIFGGLVGGDLMTWCVYSCVIPVIIFTVLAFFVGKEAAGTPGGVFCALLFALTPTIVSRTITGFADTDGFILVFSLLAAFFWIRSLKGQKSLLYSALAGFSVFLFELTWVGYWHMLYLLVGASAGYVILHLYMKKEVDISQGAVLLLAFLIPHSFYDHYIIEGVILTCMAAGYLFSLHMKKGQQATVLLAIIFCAYFLYSEGLLLPLRQQFSASGAVTARGGVFYPYTGPFISQRQEVTAQILLERLATTLILAPIGLYILLRNRSEKHYALFIFLALYMVGGITMTFEGVRFLLLLSVPILFSSSIALSFIWKKVAKDSPGRKTVAVCLVAVLFAPLYVTAEKANEEGSPIGNRWQEALSWIEENTPEDSVIIADWGYGYWIESAAHRRSIMNGKHYDISWRLLKFGMMLSTTDEEIAAKEVYGFDTLSEVAGIRMFPSGDKGEELMELEMSPFALDNQDAYVVVDTRTALVFDVVSGFGTWDYTTGKGEPVRLYGGTHSGTVLEPYWKQYVYNTFLTQIVIYEAQGEYHSYILEKNSIMPTEGTLYVKNGETYFLKREEGFEGVAWFYPDAFMIFIPTDSLDSMMARLFFFNGEGLEYFELVGDFGTVKVYKVHREPQENLNEEIPVKQDDWRPA